MANNPNKLSQFWQELKRRNVVRVITVYAGAAFVIIELINNITEPLRLPEWTPTLVIVLLAIGFPIAIIFSWLYDIHPEGGIVKTEPANKLKTAEISKSSSNWKIASYISFVVIVGLILLNVVPRAINKKIVDKSIAVLPFEDMSIEQDQEYFCDGIAEEIINSLAQLDSLKVIARTSTFAFKNKQTDIREIGEILGVSTVMEGSVQKAGDRLRITAQLINAEDGSHLWSERFDREFNDIFSIQDEISMAIVEKLKIELLGNQGGKAGNRQTENPDAYNLYLKGRYFWHRRTQEDLYKSIQNFEQAIEIDPNYALAYAGMGDAYFIMSWWGSYPRDEGYEKAKTYLKKALSINENLPEAHATLGGVFTWYDRDWKAAEKELLYAIALNPNDANAYQYLSELMSILGKNKDALKYIDKAIRLNPHSQTMYNLRASYYYDEGAYEEAIEDSMKSLEIFQYGWPMQRIFKCNIRLGNDLAAVENLKEIVSMDPSVNDSEMIDTVFQDSGIEGVIKWFILWLQESSSPDFFLRMNLSSRVASLYGLLGDAKQTLVWLQKSLEAGDSNLLGQKFFGDFAFLKDDPKFQAIYHELGL